MTDENPIPVPSTPVNGPAAAAGTPVGAPPGAPPGDRARIEPSPPQKRLDALPVLYLVGFVILAASLIYLWKHPGLPRDAALEVRRMDTVRSQVNAVQARVDQLEQRPAAAAPNLAPLEARLAALEQRPAPDLRILETRLGGLETRPAPLTDLGPIERRLIQLETKPPVDLAPLDARIAALDAKPPVDLAPLQSRIAGLEAKPPVDLTPLQAKLDAAAKQAADQAVTLTRRLDALDAQLKQTATALAATNEKAQRAGKLQAAAGALEAGQKLGDIPGAPPALARFAQTAPPTEAGLRLSFDKAADAAHQASQPAITDGQPLLSRMWTKAQQSVTVRQGDRVLVGDPIAGVLASARQSLDAGDLAGAVKTLDGLAGPAKAAMTTWLEQAHALLDARAAIGDLAART